MLVYFFREFFETSDNGNHFLNDSPRYFGFVFSSIFQTGQLLRLYFFDIVKKSLSLFVNFLKLAFKSNILLFTCNSIRICVLCFIECLFLILLTLFNFGFSSLHYFLINLHLVGIFQSIIDLAHFVYHEL